MRVLLVGAGALGGCFGACLHRAGRDNTFLVRPKSISQTWLRRGPVSETARVSQGMVTGFEPPGYYLALPGVRGMLAAEK